MGVLQDALDTQIKEVPRLGLEQVIREKLAAEGVDDDAVVAQIVDALLDGKSGSFDIPSDRPLKLSFYNEDFQRIEARVSALCESLPALVETLTQSSAYHLAAALKEQWKASKPDADHRAETRDRILRDWHEPFDRLRMLVTLCAEEGDKFNIAHLQSDRGESLGRTDALTRLHIRACRIAEEILLLLEYGHTEGAQARWRTLHEVAITATLISEGGDALAARYFDHEVVERKKALDDHNRSATAAGEPVVPRSEARQIESELEFAAGKYGKHFKGAYGWASNQLGLPANPQFHDLQQVAGCPTLKLRYRLASFDVHASPKTLAQPVHQWDPTTHVPGTFAAGFEEPGADTAQAIGQVTTLLYPEPWDLDSLTFVATLAVLREETAEAFFRVARDIERREQRTIERAMRRPSRRMGYVKAKPGKRKT